ncbi:hypothetical protein ACFQ3J_04065 [Paenibacillus provencensis]|uniref:Methyl-accepting chemotaxis protein n=1 Tax=Paenibacillus provencensis TaxID=441151 RepID=A0ABW3PZM4_9BACL|nr:hypothetical protein [Paenibacillus sp. MER 78]MCM3126830.1 hypothetical protein [Paenibacillus sp. MER 78]
MKYFWKKQTSKLIIGLLSILLVSSAALNISLLDYKEAQTETNERLWNEAVSKGFSLPLEDIAYLTEKLKTGDLVETDQVVNRLDQAARNLEQGGRSLSQMEPFFRQQDSASTRVMANLLQDYHQYVESDILQPLESANHLSHKSHQLLLKDLDRLQEDLVYLKNVMSKQSITKDKPTDIQKSWKQAIQKVIEQNPDHAFHQRMSEKYDWI